MYSSLNVDFTSGLKLHADFRETWKCLTFFSCDYWKPATRIYWSPIPRKTFVAFFDTDSCWHGEKWYFISHDQGNTVKFDKPRAIRSMMIGRGTDYFRRPHIIHHECKLEQENSTVGNATDIEVIVTTTNSSDEWGDNTIAINGGLSCEYWQPATTISWENLAYNQFAAFYETDTCWDGGKYQFLSGQDPGSVEFKGNQPIRSMMVGEIGNYGRRPSVIFHRCGNDANERTGVNTTVVEVTRNNSISSSDNFSITDSSSSNWTDLLPE
ncbi:Hypothetical protein PHPALM_7266 [Phytophthora palmivora]|uniref:Uncharacterized protein n=1 Tax=Phytophthora palmivora TaxID=4796 RepID=A0A2P4YCT3_9STRA|nr:Hypothetical protein PHPALM_7266 [Phytophthora palmivora]